MPEQKGRNDRMKLTDEKIIKILKKARCYDLEYHIETREPQEGEEEMTDLDVVLDELEWTLEKCENDGWVQYEDLSDARKLLRETKHGKRIPIDVHNGFRPKQGYAPSDIKRAKETVNEYNRMKRLRDRLWNLKSSE